MMCMNTWSSLQNWNFGNQEIFYQKSEIDREIFFNESEEKLGGFLFEFKGALYAFFL
jgi:hypothetical protein